MAFADFEGGDRPGSPGATLAVAGDTPIDRRDQDEFERWPLARRIAIEAQSAPAGGGFVIAICGRWGSGKTSVARMAIKMLDTDGVMVVRFNPWMFSGHDDLVLRFFAEVTATMGRDGRSKFKAVVGRFSDYAAAIAGAIRYAPVGGQTASNAVALVGSFARAAAGRVQTLDALYHDLADHLRDLDQRIVVFVDDIDRLTDAEVRDVVRLVKSVGDLPNISYLLAFDRFHVESVLGGHQTDEYGRRRGRAYLEKIVQSRYDVPPPRRGVLVSRYLPRQLGATLQRAGVADPNALLMPLERALSGLVSTPRDVNRLANAVAGAIDLHGGEVAVVDLVGLETLRTIEPDVHARLDSVADILLGEDWRSFFESDDEVKRDHANRLDALLSRASAREATLLLLQQLFPAGRADLGGGRPQKDDDQEDRANRVTVRRIFWRYVHATIPETDVSSLEVQTVADALQDPQEFARRISEYQDKRLGDLLARLSGYWEDFDPKNVVPLGRVLLDIGTRLDNDDSPFRMRLEPAVWQFERLLGRLLASELDPRQRAENVRALVQGAPHISARMRLIVWFGTFPQREGRGEDRDMLTQQQTRGLMADLRREILSAAPTDLASEIELSLLMREALAVDRRRAQRQLARKAEDSAFVLALLRECIVSVHTGSSTRYEFHWRQLAEMIGESAARRAVIRFSSQVKPDDYDFRTREGLRQAVAVARGEAEPSKLFDDLERVP